MQAKVTHALGHRFVFLSAEASPGLSPDAAFRDLLEQCNRELETLGGLSLENTVRTRLWGRTAADREAASAERRKLLTGKARSSSSSYIAPGHFFSPAGVAVDLIAMEPSRRGTEKVVVEYDPPIAPPLYIVYDGIVFLSGLCLVEPSLEVAVPKTIAQLADFLSGAGIGLEKAVLVASYLQRAYTVDAMRRLLQPAVKETVPLEFVLVDGHAVPGAHVEIEITARL